MYWRWRNSIGCKRGKGRNTMTGNDDESISAMIHEMQGLMEIITLSDQAQTLLARQMADQMAAAGLKLVPRDYPEVSKMASDDEDLANLVKQKDAAYHERNQLVALLAALFPSSLERHPDEDTEWENDWRNIVYMDTPAGQLSWHLHDSELPLFDHVPRLQGRTWDGHTTEEKYGRVQALIVRKSVEREVSMAMDRYVGESLSAETIEDMADTLKATLESSAHIDQEKLRERSQQVGSPSMEVLGKIANWVTKAWQADLPVGLDPITEMLSDKVFCPQCFNARIIAKSVTQTRLSLSPLAFSERLWVGCSRCNHEWDINWMKMTESGKSDE